MAQGDPTIVVGAGIAGLMCARTLAQAGVPVVVLERQAEVGGRVRTTATNGYLLDHGFQVLFEAYPTLAGALDLPALELCAFPPAARLAQPGGASWLVGDAFRDPGLLFPTLAAPGLSLGDKVRMLRLRRFATGLRFDDCFAERFDSQSTRDFLRARGFTPQAIASFFAPFYGGILLDRTLESSASILLYTFKMMSEGRTVIPARGMGAIPASLAAQLPAGSVRTRTNVIRVVRNGDRATGVELEDGTVLSASNVVLACDPPAIAALAQTAQLFIPVPTASLGCTTVYLGSRPPLLAGSALWLNAGAGATVSHAVTISNVAPSYAPPGRALTAATVLGDAARLPDDELVGKVRRDLQEMGGEAESATAELLAVWRVPYSQYVQRPGSVARRIPARTEVHGVFIASELGHTSSLEGAALGGTAAAQAVLRGSTAR